MSRTALFPTAWELFVATDGDTYPRHFAGEIREARADAYVPRCSRCPGRTGYGQDLDASPSRASARAKLARHFLKHHAGEIDR